MLKLPCVAARNPDHDRPSKDFARASLNSITRVFSSSYLLRIEESVRRLQLAPVPKALMPLMAEPRILLVLSTLGPFDGPCTICDTRGTPSSPGSSIALPSGSSLSAVQEGLCKLLTPAPLNKMHRVTTRALFPVPTGCQARSILHVAQAHRWFQTQHDDFILIPLSRIAVAVA